MPSHIVVTRFNVGIYSDDTMLCGRQSRLRNKDKDKWVRNRLDLMEQVCLKSLKSQKSQNFKWIVLVDEKTPSHLLLFIIATVEPYGKVIVTPTLDGKDWFNSVFNSKEFIEDAIKLNSKNWIDKAFDDDGVLYSTRLDSDDALHPNFISLTQDLASKFVNNMPCGEKVCIDFPQTCFHHKERFSIIKYDGGTHAVNVAHTLIETSPPYTTSCSMNHMLIGKTCKVLKYDTVEPMVMRMVHDDNTLTIKSKGYNAAMPGCFKHII